jgi:3-deoxy-D-manno-octulosonic-acid transferase
METELWPTLLERCHRRGIPASLVNARLSARSAKRYLRFPGITRQMLARLDVVCTQTGRDAERFRGLGAPRVQVTGNLKFDRSVPPQQLALGEQLRQQFGADRPILLAASTRDGEEALLLEAVTAIDTPALLTVIVPRHPQRFDDVADLLRKAGVAFRRRSENQPVDPSTRIVLGDSMGEMFAYYVACDIAFIGGSLLPLGGQNLLEACAVGKPVIVGPHTFNFEEATEQAIEAGAALRVADAGEVTTTVAALLADATRRKKIGTAGHDFMDQHRGATGRTLTAIGM